MTSQPPPLPRHARRAPRPRRWPRAVNRLGPPSARHRRPRQGGADGTEINGSGIARAAAIDRSFLYRHRDLPSNIHALQAPRPPVQ